MKIKTRFLIIFISISIIPIIIITAFMYNRYTTLIKERMLDVFNNVVDNAAEDTTDVINDIDKMTSVFQLYTANSYSIIEDIKKYQVDDGSYTTYDLWESRNNMKYIFQNLIYNNEYLNGIFIFTPSGENLGYGWGSGIDIDPDYTPFDDDWYQNTLDKKGGIYISDISTKPFIIRGKNSISFSRALYDVFSREFLGVLYIDCSPELLDLAGSNTLPDTALLSITKDNSSLLYTNIDDISYSFSGLSSNEIEITKRSIDKYNLTIIASISLPQLSEHFNDAKAILILIALSCSLTFTIISFILSNYLTEPITALSKRMRDNKKHGLITTNKYLNRSDEIGILFNEYNNMIEELNHYIKNEYQDKLIVLDSQMRSLEAQINSHFLFNTLESINSIAEIEEVERIATMSLALGNMFRYSIKTESELVTIADELNHVNDYISIQQIRFDYRFKITYHMKEEMKTIRILKLILQPLIENSLYHGLNQCSSDGLITIHAYKENSIIFLTVSDDGVGMSSEQLQEIHDLLATPVQITELGRRTKQSIGLKNIHSRLQLYYGLEYGLSITSKQDHGTSITLRLPVAEGGNTNV